MSREWKPRPGDVALIRYVDDDDGDLVVGIATTPLGNWRTQEHGTTFAVEPVRPLVVIDPEDPDQLERLAEVMPGCENPRTCGQPLRCMHKRLREAFREFANPAPPKPDEPQGLGAVVEDLEGARWLRVAVEGFWARWGAVDDDEGWLVWHDLDAVRVLSTGVEVEE